MFEPIHNKNNYQYIVDQIKQLILDGELIVGDRLPSERDLSEMYQVSRASVREALKALETIGLLESRHGGGNYIVNHLKEQLTDNLSLVCLLYTSKTYNCATLFFCCLPHLSGARPSSLKVWEPTMFSLSLSMASVL